MLILVQVLISPSGNMSGCYTSTFSVNIGLNSCLANRHLSGQHGGVEVVACTRTTHSRDTVGGGSGVLLVQGL